jgi:photosystem II stability/assembly factor-like uncharacterized protein
VEVRKDLPMLHLDASTLVQLTQRRNDMNLFFKSRPLSPALAVVSILAVLSSSVWAADPKPKSKPKREHPKPLIDVPLRGDLKPKAEVPVFAVASSGLRVLTSKDDGKTWKQSLLLSDNAGDGGHGPYGVHGFVYADGMFSIYSGWGSSGYWLGSIDGENWAHLSSTREGTNYANVLGAAAAPGILVNSGSGSASVSRDLGKTWNVLKMRSMDIRTHHMKCAIGDYDGGRIVVAGDGPMVVYSKDQGKTWKAGDISGAYTKNKGRFFVAGNMVYGNGVFLINSGDQGTVTRSTDGGATWSDKIDPGAERIAYRALSFVRDEFWLAGRKPRASKDGLTWHDLPDAVPPGPVAESDSGTLICVTGDKIYRSTNGDDWKVVFTVPEKDSSWTLRHVAFGKVAKAKSAGK